MPGLIDREFPAVRQADCRQQPPPLIGDVARHFDAFGPQLGQGGLDVVTHQVQLVPPVAVVEELEAGGFVVIVPGAVPVPGVLVRSVDDAPPWLPELAAPELAPVPDAPALPALPPVDCACASPSSATAAIVAREVTSVLCDMVDLLKKK